MSGGAAMDPASAVCSKQGVEGLEAEAPDAAAAPSPGSPKAAPKAGGLSERCRYWPSALCGLALGNAALGSALRYALEASDEPFWPSVQGSGAGRALQATLALLALVPLALYLTKAALCPGQVKADICDSRPISAATCAGAMALAHMSRPLYDLHEELGVALWYASLALFLGLQANFLLQRFRQWNPQSWWQLCTPAWFIPTVGVGVWAATGATMPRVPDGWAWAPLLMSLAWTVVTWPPILYRLLLHDSLPGPLFPTMFILMGPVSMCATAWFAVCRGSCDDVFGHLLLAATLASWLSVLRCYRRLVFGTPPAPVWASYTFPSVVFANALARYAGVLPAGSNARATFRVLSWLALLHAGVLTLFADVVFVRLAICGQLAAPYPPDAAPRHPLACWLPRPHPELPSHGCNLEGSAQLSSHSDSSRLPETAQPDTSSDLSPGAPPEAHSATASRV